MPVESSRRDLFIDMAVDMFFFKKEKEITLFFVPPSYPKHV